MDKYLDRHVESARDAEVVKTYLEEVIERCKIIEEEVINSIENWADILPEDVKRTHLGLISDLIAEIEAIEREREALAEDLRASQGRSKEETDALKHQLREKEEELEEASAELRQRQQSVSGQSSPESIVP